MKKLNLFLLLIAFSFGLFAAPVSLETARSIADNFYKNYSVKSNIAVSEVITYQNEGVNTFYVFVYENSGFVIISADDAITPILGYSTNEPFDKNNIPVNAANWLNSYNKHIKYLINKNLSNKETIKEWNKIKNKQFEKSLLAVTPLCATTWDQSSPYNQLCPTNTYTGCVATAMAQIMKYWAYPTNGVGSHSYTHATYGTLTADFGGTTYQWSSMLNSYLSGSTSAQKTAVATLMFHCGVAVDMDYGTSGSGAYSFDVPPALINYFNYSPSAEIKYLASFTTANWILMLKAELDASRPVYYSGSGSAGGHAFVCDGYNSSNQFHFNWGWSGMSNGYFTIGSLNPSGDDFNTDNSVVVRIKPPSSGPIANFTADNLIPAVGGSVNFTDNSTGTPVSWSWTFDGGTPATSSLQNPTNITYSTLGQYQVSLTITDGSGNQDTKIKTAYINVGGSPSAWIKQNSGFATASHGIDQIFIVNPYIVWAKAYDGSGGAATIQEFTRTTNGGLTWTPGTITFTNSTTYGIANLFPFNDTVCIAAMYPSTAANGGVIVKTIDGGLTWSILPNSPSYSTSWLNLVYFFNQNEGLCMGDPTSTTAGSKYLIYTTSDGGNTWTQTPNANIPGCTASETGIVNLCDGAGGSFWFGTTKGRVYKTTDKGLTWTVTVTGLGTSAAVTPRFKDANVGFAIGDNYTTAAYIGIKKTIDGGATWTALTPSGFYVKSPNLDYVPGTTSMWVDGSAGPSHGSAYSLDDCATFLDIDTGATDIATSALVQYTYVSFYDDQTGWAGGFNVSSTDGGIYKWDSSILTSIPKTNTEITDEIRVYPNPTQDMINIEFSVVPNKKVVVNLYNILGENVLSKEITSNTNVAQLNLAGNKSGIYLLTIDNGTKKITNRISLIE
jgi:PKD repeat protein